MSFALVLTGTFLLGLVPYFGTLMALVAFLAAAAVGIPIGIKRLHDRNKSGQWLILFYLVPAVLNVVVGTSDSMMLGSLLGLVDFAVAAWGFVELGLLRGSEGPNRYGADPLELTTFRTA